MEITLHKSRIILSCVLIQSSHSLRIYNALHKKYLFLQTFLPLNLLGFVTDSINWVKTYGKCAFIRICYWIPFDVSIYLILRVNSTVFPKLWKMSLEWESCTDSIFFTVLPHTAKYMHLLPAFPAKNVSVYGKYHSNKNIQNNSLSGCKPYAVLPNKAFHVC